jgi:hypothetical protein
VQTGKEKEMSEVKPKIERARKYRRPTRAVGPIKKEFSTKALGLESHTFDIGNGQVQVLPTTYRESTPSLQILGFPKARTGETIVDPGDICLWQ